MRHRVTTQTPMVSNMSMMESLSLLGAFRKLRQSINRSQDIKVAKIDKARAVETAKAVVAAVDIIRIKITVIRLSTMVMVVVVTANLAAEEATIIDGVIRTILLTKITIRKIKNAKASISQSSIPKNSTSQRKRMVDLKRLVVELQAKEELKIKSPARSIRRNEKAEMPQILSLKRVLVLYSVLRLEQTSKKAISMLNRSSQIKRSLKTFLHISNNDEKSIRPYFSVYRSLKCDNCVSVF